MSNVFNRQALISLIPRQVMLETATKAAATSLEDNYKKKKRKDKGVAAMGVEDDRKKSKKRKSDKISDVSEDVSCVEEALDQARPRGDVLSRNGMGLEDLLRSIAEFLEGRGFAKTLSVFQLEAKIEVNSRVGSCINLEKLFDKFIDSSQREPVPSIEWSKEQGILGVDAAGESNTKAKENKRKDKPASDTVEENALKNCLDASIAENIDYENSLNFKKKKKHKVILGENKGEEDCLNFVEVNGKTEELKEVKSKPSYETGKVEKDRSEKKKKNKEANRSLEGFELEKPNDGGDYTSNRHHQESMILSGSNKGGEGCLNFEVGDTEKNIGEKKKKKKKKDAHPSLEQFDLGVNLGKVILGKSSGEDFVGSEHQESVCSKNIAKDLQENVERSKKHKNKDNAKKPEKSTSDSLPTINSDKLSEDAFDGLGNNDNDVLQKSGFRKESIVISEENSSDAEKSTNKKRKVSSSNETSIVVENIVASIKSKLTKSDAAKDEMKTEDNKVLTCSEPAQLNGESKESSGALPSIILDTHEKYPSIQKQLNGHQPANGNVEKLQNEGSTRMKSMKKEKRSREQKEVNAFQRIKIDDVQFADERLQDNSYWALDDSGSGYGAKAQEVLGQVRGRDFRHEKTKKKRGSYRGGQIDLEAHSVKFNFSDDE